ACPTSTWSCGSSSPYEVRAAAPRLLFDRRLGELDVELLHPALDARGPGVGGVRSFQGHVEPRSARGDARSFRFHERTVVRAVPDLLETSVPRRSRDLGGAFPGASHRRAR